MTHPSGLQFNVFSTDNFEPGERWEAWRESISVIFDVRPSDQASQDRASACVQAYNLGPIVFGDASFSPQRYGRDCVKIRRDGIDHFLVQLYLEGGFTGCLDRRPVEVRPGDMCFLDLAQPLDTQNLHSRAYSLVIHRDLLEGVLPGGGALHGSVLRRETGLCALLSDHLVSLANRLSHLSWHEGPGVADATVSILAACYRPCARLAERAREPLACASMNRIKRHIEANLRSPELDPASICKAMGLSRAALYRLFEPLGGVASYIRSRRLVRAYADITQPSKLHRSVRDISSDWGFCSEAHFCRLFRRTFERTPGDARSLARIGPGAGPHAAHGWDAGFCGRGYADWLRALSSAPAAGNG